jgi:hypothetical protein
MSTIKMGCYNVNEKKCGPFSCSHSLQELAGGCLKVDSWNIIPPQGKVIKEPDYANTECCNSRADQ